MNTPKVIYRLKSLNETKDGSNISHLEDLAKGRVFLSSLTSQNDSFESKVTFDEELPSAISDLRILAFSLKSKGEAVDVFLNQLTEVRTKYPERERDYLIKIIKDMRPFVIEEIKRARETTGIASFTEKPNNLLLWDYYGNSFRGIMFGFNVNKLLEILPKDHFILNVKYSETFPSISYDDLHHIYSQDLTRIKDHFYQKFLAYKHSETAFEKEARLIGFPVDKSENFVNRNIDADLAPALDELIFGCNIELELRNHIMRISREANPNVKFKTAQPSEGEYGAEIINLCDNMHSY